MTIEKLEELIADTLACDVEEVKPEANLIEDLKADSLSIVELQMNIEDETGAKIPDEEIPNLHTVKDVYDAIKKYAA
ncbi:MAG: acyl carrier protein [Lachnospiraceae bacterium]|nr:acyl carrier protein [Lachnospiraceae bacterium]